MTKTNGNGGGGTSIHIALQGKGGVGKSLISAMLSQYLLSRGQDVHGIDADPVNQTLSEYRGLASMPCTSCPLDNKYCDRIADIRLFPTPPLPCSAM